MADFATPPFPIRVKIQVWRGNYAADAGVPDEVRDAGEVLRRDGLGTLRYIGEARGFDEVDHLWYATQGEGCLYAHNLFEVVYDPDLVGVWVTRCLDSALGADSNARRVAETLRSSWEATVDELVTVAEGIAHS